MILQLIARKEWKAIWHNRSFLPGALVLLCIGLLAATVAWRKYQTAETARLTTSAQYRQQWEQQPAGDAHGAAHYGTMVFKPLTLPVVFDNGLNDLTGYAMRIEAHVQHNIATVPVRPADTYLRFGTLTIATVLQLFFPLFIIFCGYDACTREKESGTLRLLMIQGVSRQQLIIGKLRVYLTLNAGLLLLMILLPAAFFITRATPNPEEYTKIAILLLLYLVYGGIFTLLSVGISGLTANSRQALVILLSIWLAGNVLLPRITAAYGEQRHPLPSREAFQAAIDKTLKSGWDGKTTMDMRKQQLEKHLLQQYGKDSVQQLPLNIEGLWLQTAEDYTQQVYEHALAATDSIIQLQNRPSSVMAWLDPYLAIRQLSMAVCGTDYFHQQHFAAAARNYRNDFIRRLNMKMAYGGSYKDFYREMEVFQYTPPSTAVVLRQQLPAVVALTGWLLLTAIGIYLISSRQNNH